MSSFRARGCGQVDVATFAACSKQALTTRLRRTLQRSPTLEQMTDAEQAFLDPVLTGALDAVWEPAASTWRAQS